MLAQNFKTAKQLRIRLEVRDALIKLLALMDSGQLRHVRHPAAIIYRGKMTFDGLFNMGLWCEETECGTVGCLAGNAELIGGIDIDQHETRALHELFYPSVDVVPVYSRITVPQAAMALRNYLTFGHAKWAECLA